MPADMVDVISLLLMWAHHEYDNRRGRNFHGTRHPTAKRCNFDLIYDSLEVTHHTKIIENPTRQRPPDVGPQAQVLASCTFKNGLSTSQKQRLTKSAKHGKSTVTFRRLTGVNFGDTSNTKLSPRLQIDENHELSHHVSQTEVHLDRDEITVDGEETEYAIQDTVTVPPKKIIETKVLSSETKYAAEYEVTMEIRGNISVRVTHPGESRTIDTYGDDFFSIIDRYTVPHPQGRYHVNRFNRSVSLKTTGRIEGRFAVDEKIVVDVIGQYDTKVR